MLTSLSEEYTNQLSDWCVRGNGGLTEHILGARDAML